MDGGVYKVEKKDQWKVIVSRIYIIELKDGLVEGSLFQHRWMRWENCYGVFFGIIGRRSFNNTS